MKKAIALFLVFFTIFALGGCFSSYEKESSSSQINYTYNVYDDYTDEEPQYEGEYEYEEEEEEPSGPMVWIPRTGSKYHSNSRCSNMKNPSQVSKSEAVNLGYDPCSKCY